MTKLNDPDLVRREYASEAGLAARRAAYANAEGPDAPAMVFDAVAEVSPKRVLEVGCGMGQLAERLHEELDGDVVAIDQSERMVELTRERGVDARVADVQELPFGDGEFDVVVAAWMLYHVPDVERALDEIVRVLGTTGRLVTATNRPDHLKELRALVGVTRTGLEGFDADCAQRLLPPRFGHIEERDAAGTVTFVDRDAVAAYIQPSLGIFGDVGEIPALDRPLVVSRRPVIFVADK
ncbi:MAG: class I SAM-dependent methyltransferase [Gaiellaceae bacterium]